MAITTKPHFRISGLYLADTGQYLAPDALNNTFWEIRINNSREAIVYMYKSNVSIATKNLNRPTSAELKKYFKDWLGRDYRIKKNKLTFDVETSTYTNGYYYLTIETKGSFDAVLYGTKKQ
jgi:hypothetical protein